MPDARMLHRPKDGQPGSAEESGPHSGASECVMPRFGGSALADSAEGHRQQGDGSSVIVSCETRSAPQRMTEDSFLQSTGLSAVCLSSQLRGRSPSAHLTVRQHSCSALRPGSGRGKHASAGSTTSGVTEFHVPDSYPCTASKGSQPGRLAVISATCSFKAASGLQLSEGSEMHALQPFHKPDSPVRLIAVHAITACKHDSNHNETRAADGCAPTKPAVKSHRLTADDVAAVCTSIDPGSEAAGGVDALVQVHIASSSKSAEMPPGGTEEVPTTTGAGPRAARRSSDYGRTPARPEALQQLMGVVTTSRQVADVVWDVRGPPRESAARAETTELTAKSFDSPVTRPSLLQHIYSASPEQAMRQQAGGEGAQEIKHASSMSLSGSAMLRGQALSAVISHTASAQHVADNMPELPGSPVSDTVSIMHHGIQSPWRGRTAQTSHSTADSSWTHGPGQRMDSSSGLMHADSSAAWVAQHRRRAGNREQSPGTAQASEALTDTSGLSMGAPTRCYFKHEPRHMFNQGGGGTAATPREAPGSAGEVPQGAQNNGNHDPTSQDLQVGEKGGSMMLPLPPLMSMLH